ncbi:unnamed protein product [Rhizopus stolonifer]
MYQDAFEEDDLIAEVELVTQTRYSKSIETNDKFDVEIASNQTSNIQIPDPVKNFICNFTAYYLKRAWPESEIVAPLVNNDQIFIILYRELYYRHIYSYLTPTLDHRFRSYENYCDLFNYILSKKNHPGPVSLELPNQWLWDIIDEFIYHFQSFCNFRDRIKKTEQEVKLLEENAQMWSSYSVLNILSSFVQKSCINEQLLVSKNGGDMIETAGEYGSHQLYKMLGYFSLVGLLRVHCMLCDYTLALKTMENVVLNKKATFARVTACHVSTYYYVGFVYMMTRRYADAIRAFSTILSFIHKTKQYHSSSYQFDQNLKKSDQMYALLAICIALSPTRLDENIHSQLREKHGEQLYKMQKGEESLQIYTNLFQYACPKFILPCACSSDPHQQQVRVFMSDIENQINLPILRSFMKLYATMGIDKLAKFLEVDSEELRTQLLIFKQRSRQYKWTSGNLLEGEYVSTFDLDFCIKQDVIHISESKVARRYGDWFLRNINRSEDILANLELYKSYEK